MTTRKAHSARKHKSHSKRSKSRKYHSAPSRAHGNKNTRRFQHPSLGLNLKRLQMSRRDLDDRIDRLVNAGHEGRTTKRLEKELKALDKKVRMAEKLFYGR